MIRKVRNGLDTIFLRWVTFAEGSCIKIDYNPIASFIWHHQLFIVNYSLFINSGFCSRDGHSSEWNWILGRF